MNCDLPMIVNLELLLSIRVKSNYSHYLESELGAGRSKPNQIFSIALKQ